LRNLLKYRLSLLTANVPSYVKAVGITAAGQFINILISLIAIRITTELAPPAVLGQGNLLLMLLGLGSQIFLVPVTNTAVRFHSEFLKLNQTDRLYSDAAKCVTKLTPLIWILWTVICFAIQDLQSTSSLINRWLLGLVWISGNGLLSLTLSRLVAEARRPVYVGLNVLLSCSTATTTAISLFLSPSAESILAASAFSVWLTFLISQAFTERQRRPLELQTPSHFSTRLREYGVHFSYLAILNWVANSAERFVLAAISGPAFTGNYIASFSISSRAMLLSTTTLSDLFRVPLFNAANQGQDALAKSIFWRWLLLAVVVALAGAIFFQLAGTWVANILLAEEYRTNASRIMAWGALAYGTWGICSVLEIRLLSFSASNALAIPMAVGAASNIIFPAFMISARGSAEAAAQGTFLAFALQALATAIVLARLSTPKK
jgi:O-antigen/teichoic acid export membrane protein